MTRAYALALGAGTPLFAQGFGEAILGTHKGTRDLLLGVAWVINLAVAESAHPSTAAPRQEGGPGCIPHRSR